MFIQQEPIVVEVFKQPDVARDISVDVVVGMFSMTGVALLFAALGGLVVGAIFVGIRRFRDGWRCDGGTRQCGTVRGERYFRCPAKRLARFRLIGKSR